MKMVSVIGARPQFIKAAAVSRILRQQHHEVLIHTGQHYDYEMSGIFFDGLPLPAPDINLSIGSGTHATQTSLMLKGIEDVLLAEQPDWVIVYGDTNSTLAAALAASKVSVKVAHVEAGLRSFNRCMPEEINRVIADHLSDMLLCPSETAVQQLAAEGISQNVHDVGDVMRDVQIWAQQQNIMHPRKVLATLDLKEKAYVLATLHRSQNTDDPVRLDGIVCALNSLEEPVVFPVHPRIRKIIADRPMGRHVHLITPQGYLDMMTLTANARLVLTDSGGLQKEAYWLGVPCITMRDETEWVETVRTGWNILVGACTDRILDAVHSFAPTTPRPSLYGDGSAAVKCVSAFA